MSNSTEIFALRRAGHIEEAYTKALEIIECNPTDEWNIKAFGWCIYDLIRNAVSQQDYESAKQYVFQLNKVQIDVSDEVLFRSIEHAKNLACPEKKIIFEAKEQSRLGNHESALSLFREAIKLFPNEVDLNTQFAWELQKEAKVIFESPTVNSLQVRQLLAEYMKLKNERPSVLHSSFLRYANKITEKEDFKLIAFLKLWDLSNLREDDFTPFVKDGNTYPSIAEKIIQHAAKIILDKKQIQDADYFLPFLDKGISRFQNNIWLTYYKAKILHLLNRSLEAVEFLIPVVKEKIGEYWTWNLLAELLRETDIDKATSCFCKSLLCKGEEKFLSNVRTKFAEILIQKEFFSEARFEIQTVIKTKQEEKVPITEKLIAYTRTDWYKTVSEKKSNNDFYISNKNLAEEFIFHSLPWIRASLGGTFTIPDRPDRPRRKIFVQYLNDVIEVVISDKKFATSKKIKEGDSIRIKGEYDEQKVFQIYLLEKEDTTHNFAIFEWYNGNIIHIHKNTENKITALRASFVVNGILKEGVIELNQLKEKIPFKEGLPILVKYFQKKIQKITFPIKPEKVNVLTIQERASGLLWDSFPDSIGIIDHVNYDRNIAHFIVNKQINGVINVNQLKKIPEIGDKVLMKLKKVTKGANTYYTVLTSELTDLEPVEKIIRDFNGRIEIVGSFGFASDVFIDQSLIGEFQIKNFDDVQGKAILNYNNRKAIWGWKAITISSLNQGASGG